MFELKQVTRNYLMILKIDAKFEGKLTFAFNNDMRNDAKFGEELTAQN